MEIKREKIVCIIGAGASADFGFPLGNEFFKQAKEFLALESLPDYLPKKDIQNSIDFLRDNLPKIYPNLSEDVLEWPAIEEILTLSYELGFQSIFDYAVLFVEQVLTSMHGKCFSGNHQFLNNAEPKYESRYLKLALWITKIVSSSPLKSDVSFVSFNYDLLFDFTLAALTDYHSDDDVPFDRKGVYQSPNSDRRIIEDYCYGVTLFEANNPTVQVRNKGIKLLKPHGSINLAHCSDCNKYYYSPYNLVYPISHKRDYTVCCGKRLTPLIIPPAYNKIDKVDNNLSNYLSIVVANIKEAISRANKIVVIGYSFPSYDVEVKSWLLESLAANKNKINWEIIDKGDTIEKSLKNIIPQNATINKEGFWAYIEREMDDSQKCEQLVGNG